MSSLDNSGPFVRRQHALLGHFLAIKAWLHGLECIVLVREDLESFLDLVRFKSVRVQWLQKDLKAWFPYQEAYYLRSQSSSVHSLFLSRVPIDAYLPSGAMTTEERIARMRPNAPRTATFSEITGGKTLPETEEVISYLGLLSVGLADPRAHVVLSVRRRRRKDQKPVQGSDTTDMEEALVDAFSNVLLGERIPLDIRAGKNRRCLIPANRRITRFLISQMAASASTLQINPSPIQIRILGIRNEIYKKFGISPADSHGT